MVREWHNKRTAQDCAQALAQNGATYEEFFGKAGSFEIPLSSAPAFFFGRLHHELYLSDPRRVPPERLRTILRHPVA